MRDFDMIISVVKRENNKDRSFLFLNKYQAKYIPTDPLAAINLFSHLGFKIEKKVKKTVVIGFAETATAIGAIVCENISSDAFYIHSTREDLGKLNKLHFREEHSHAKNHQLCLENLEILKNCERFIFVDDEFTTGKTICNFISALKDAEIIDDAKEIIVTTLINCMKNEDNFKLLGIKYEYIIKEDRDWSKTPFEGETISDISFEIKKETIAKIFKVKGALDTRKGVIISEYAEATRKFAVEIEKVCKFGENYKDILILGSEEFMYPAIKVAEYFKDKYENVVCYATSRSPIAVLNSEDYVLKNRAKLHSFYDKDRIIHLYNIKKYDKIIIVTDAKDFDTCEISSLFEEFDNTDIDVVIWSK